MRKSLILFFVIALLASMLVTPEGIVHAQGISLPAEINKSFSPISIPAGGTSILRVTIFNPNPFVLTNASWTDNLVGVQPGLRIASPVGLSNTCGGSVTASAGSTTLSLSGGTVPAQTGTTPGSCTVSINVTSTTRGSLINTIPAQALTSTGEGTNITNTTPASATLNVTGASTPSVSKSFSPSTIWAGGTSQLSINITNNSLGTTLTQASITDNLPANVFVANPPSATLAGCGGGATVTAASGGTSVTLNNGSIPPSSTCRITVSVTSDVQGAYNNTIPADALQTQQGLTNATSATARLSVQEIGATKRFLPATFSSGGTTTLDITLQNPTASPYTGVNVTDNLPSPLTVVNIASNSCGGATTATTTTSIVLTGGTIPPGTPAQPGSCTVSVVISAPAGTATQTLRNTIPTANLTTNQNVGLLRSANANVTVTVGGPEVTGIKTFTPSTIAAGENSRLRIDIFAPTDTDLTNFSVTDPLPAGLTISNSTPATATGCGASAVLTAVTGATSISLTGGLIPAGLRCRIDVYVTSSTPSPAGTPYTNTIPPTNITNKENRTPTNALTANLTVTNTANLAISLVKGFDPLIVTGGASSTMSIELINPGNITLTGISFTDNMPSGMILANPLNFNVGTCGGTLSGTSGSNSFSFSGGTLPPLGSCTLTLSATMTVNGNLTNTIPAGAVTTNNGVTNTEPVAASLTNLPGASVSKAFAPNPIPTGSYSLLTITIQNTGNIGLTGMGMSDSMPAGLEIAAGSAPAPVNNCGGTLTAVPGTQLIQLANGVLAGSSSCTIVVAITGSNPGDFQNTIPVGGLRADPNTQNNNPATATLTITGNPVVSGDGGSGRNRRRGNTTTANVSSTNQPLIPVTSAGFTPGMVTKLDVPSHEAYDAMGLRIEIPVLKVDTPIVGVESMKGSWNLSWLQNQVGWLGGTAYPTLKGNSVLAAHVVNADGKPGVFYNLKSLGEGEYVFVYNAGYRYTYQVVSNTYVKQDANNVIKHEEQPYLTLITCDTYDESTGTYQRYVMVRAVLVDVREAK